MTTHVLPQQRWTALGGLNTKWHRRALQVYGAVVVLHWLEHIVQAFQIWVLDYKKPEARGVLGQWFPWLIKSEYLHWGFAVFMVVGLGLLLPGFQGRSRWFWGAAFVIQVWHMIEHQILWQQAQTGNFWWHSKAPVSVIQHYFFPMARPELHLIYNTLVTIPMIVGIFFHMYPPPRERGKASTALCTCAVRRDAAPAMAAA
jgi:hypothetical protein